MDKKRSVTRRCRYQKKKSLKKSERVEKLKAALNEGFSGWEFPTPEKRHAGLMNLFEMALARLLIEDVETMTPC